LTTYLDIKHEHHLNQDSDYASDDYCLPLVLLHLAFVDLEFLNMFQNRKVCCLDMQQPTHNRTFLGAAVCSEQYTGLEIFSSGIFTGNGVLEDSLRDSSPGGFAISIWSWLPEARKSAWRTMEIPLRNK